MYMLGRKSEDILKPGMVFAPYVMAQSVVVTDSVNVKRKKSINKIFDLGLDIQGGFTPKKLLNSRYSTSNISSKFYCVIEIKKPT